MRRTLGALGVLATLAAIALSPAWWNGRTLFPRDARSLRPWQLGADDGFRSELKSEALNEELAEKSDVTLPERALAYRLWRDEGAAPLWNPHTYCGHPLVATATPSALYPPNWLAMAFPWRADTWLALAHIVLSGLFMSLYLRAVGLSGSAGLVGGTTYAFSGWYLVHLYLPVYPYTATWFPLMLLSIERLMTGPKGGGRRAIGWFAALVAAVGLAGVAGSLPVLSVSLCACGCYALARVPLAVRAGGVRAGCGRPAVCGIAITLGLALAAVQLAPTWALSQASGPAPLSREALRDGALRPFALVGLATPDFFGNPAAAAPIGSPPPFGPLAPVRLGLDGPPPVRNGRYVHNTIYVGILPLLFAFIALCRRRRPITWIWAALAAGALAFSLAIPPLDRLAGLIPVLRADGVKHGLFLFTAAVAALAGIGFDGMLSDKKSRTGFGGHAGAVAIVSLALAAGVLAVFPAPLAALLKTLFPLGESKASPFTPDEIKAWVDNTRWCLLRLAVVLVPIAIVLHLLRRGSSVRPVSCAVVVIVFIDLAWLGYRFNPTHRPDQTASTPGIDFLREQTSNPTAPGGLGRIAHFGPEAHLVLPPNTGLLYGLDDIHAWDMFGPPRYRRFLNLIEPGMAKAGRPAGPVHSLGNLSSPLLDLLGVRYVLTARDWGKVPAPGFRRAYPLHKRDPSVVFDPERFWREGLGVYENTRAMPRAWIPLETRTLADEDEVFQALADARFDPAATVLVEGQNDLPEFSDPTAAVRMKVHRARRVLVEVEPGGPATLVLADRFAPGWTASIRYPTGEDPVAIHRANGLFRAVKLPLRDKPIEVEFHYRDVAFLSGAYASMVAAAMLALIIAISWRTSARRRAPAPNPPREEAETVTDGR